jgi:hypothetical protein
MPVLADGGKGGCRGTQLIHLTTAKSWSSVPFFFLGVCCRFGFRELLNSFANIHLV